MAVKPQTWVLVGTLAASGPASGFIYLAAQTVYHISVLLRTSNPRVLGLNASARRIVPNFLSLLTYTITPRLVPWPTILISISTLSLQFSGCAWRRTGLRAGFKLLLSHLLVVCDLLFAWEYFCLYQAHCPAVTINSIIVIWVPSVCQTLYAVWRGTKTSTQNSIPDLFLKVHMLKKKSIYLFGCTRSQLQRAGSLVVACGILTPDQGTNPGPLLWEHGISATGHQASPSIPHFEFGLALGGKGPKQITSK